MSAQVDIVQQTIEVQVENNQTVAVSILDGISILNNNSFVGLVRALNFIAGNNISLQVYRDGSKINVKIIGADSDKVQAGTVVIASNFDLSGGAIPTIGGTGSGGAILKGNLFHVTTGGSITGWSPDTAFVPAGAIMIAKVDSPGQTESNWITQY